MNVIILASRKNTSISNTEHFSSVSFIDEKHTSILFKLISQIYESCTEQTRKHLQFTIVTGFCRDSVIEEINYLKEFYKDIIINVVFNTQFNDRGEAYSLSCARHYLLEDDSLIFDGNSIFDKSLIGNIMNYVEDFREKSYSFVRGISSKSSSNCVGVLSRSCLGEETVVQYVYDKYLEGEGPIPSLSYFENCKLEESLQVWHFNLNDSSKLFLLLNDYYRKYNNDYRKFGKESIIYPINCMISLTGGVLETVRVNYSDNWYSINCKEDLDLIKELIKNKEIS